jgi:hypothetical protein
VTKLIEFAALSGALASSVLISLLIEWLSLEAFFHVASPEWRGAVSPDLQGTRRTSDQ